MIIPSNHHLWAEVRLRKSSPNSEKHTQAWEWADLCLTILYKMNIVWNEICELFNGKWMMVEMYWNTLW